MTLIKDVDLLRAVYSRISFWSLNCTNISATVLVSHLLALQVNDDVKC